MPINRRSLLALVGASLAAPGAARAGSHASPAALAEGPRGLGSPGAKVVVEEFFSLTCTHCAYFSNTVMPQVKAKLVDTGIVRFVYHDFPLDQVALMAAQVARYLPAEEYFPFISALFASQNDWAFAPNINYTDALFRYAALAGMNRPTFDAALADKTLKNFILQGQQTAETLDKIDATPTFIIGGQQVAGALEYADFNARVQTALARSKKGA